MPTALPTSQRGAAPRQRYGLFKTLGMLAILLVCRQLFAAAMWCADFADVFVRRD